MKYVSLLVCFLINQSASSQISKHLGNVSVAYSMGSIDSAFYQNFTLQGEVLVTNVIGLKWNLDYVVRNDQVSQLHTPMGLVGGPILIAIGFKRAFDKDSTTKPWSMVPGILALILPDGVCAHLTVSQHWDISPYANVLGLDFVNNRKAHSSSIEYAMSFGNRFTYLHDDKYSFATFIETRKTTTIPWSLGGGLSVGMVFGSR